MSGRPPPPCPPSAATAALTRSTALTCPARSSVTPTATLARPSLTATSAAIPEPTRCFIVSTVDAQVLGIQAFDHLAEELVAVDLFGRGGVGLGRRRRPSPAPSSRRRARARAACAPRPARRSAPEPRRVTLLSVAAASRSLASRSPSHCRAASPVSASIRRTPDETALSRDDLEQLDVAERADVGAAAQLDRIVGVAVAAHRQHAHLVAIFLAEQRHRARGNRLVGGHQPRRDRLVGADLGIHLGLDRVDLLARQRLGVREIEPEMVGRDQAALLGDVRAQMPAQRGVEQMRRAMIGADPVAALGIDLLMHRLAHRQLACDDLGRGARGACRAASTYPQLRLRSL